MVLFNGFPNSLSVLVIIVSFLFVGTQYIRLHSGSFY